MTRLALIRHGHTAWNRAGRIQGRSDIPLDPEARATLAGLALPPDWRDAALVSSPLRRAVETARLVTGRDPAPVPALTEMHWGRWEGQRGVDLLAQPGSGYRPTDAWGWTFRPPGGESVADVRQRLQPWLAGLSGDTVAVCHIGVMRVVLAQATGWAFSGPVPFRIKRNRLYVVQIDGRDLSLMPDPVRLVDKG